MVDIDGKYYKWVDGITVAELFRQTGIKPRLGLVVIDGKLVDKKKWDSYKIDDRVAINTQPMLPGG